MESCVELLASKNVGVGESQNTGTLECWDSVLFIILDCTESSLLLALSSVEEASLVEEHGL